MTWRVVAVEERAYLDFSQDFLIIRRGVEVTRVHMGEIQTLLIESPQTTFSGYLINQLQKRKINIILCDEKHMPSSQILDLAGSFDSSEMIYRQMSWSESSKAVIWQGCVRCKILNQAAILAKHGFVEESSKLEMYAYDVEEGDITNREGPAAKVYFNALFGSSFSRNHELAENAALNYGYSIILSTVAKAIASFGCLNQLGIFHASQTNNYNFACDLMEVFRPVVDDFVISTNFDELDSELKFKLRDLLNSQFIYNGQVAYLMNIIPQFVNSIISSLNECKFDKVKYFYIK